MVGGDYQGLGIVRSLGQHGIPVCIVDDERSISRYSRYATHSLRFPSLRESCQTIEAIQEAGRRFGLDGWVLFPTRDETVVAFSHAREELQRTFRVPTPSFSSIQWAWDKRNTNKLAIELEIPTPRTWNPMDLKALDKIDAEPPFVLKPAIKEHFFYKTRAKAWRANSHKELCQLFLLGEQLVGPGEVLVQELIPGDGKQRYAYCAFFKEGQAIASMVVRRRRQHPHELGRASTFVETLENPLLEEYSERFLRAMDYYGLVEIEYLFDARDEQFKLHDVNARTWGYHSLGCAAGVDFPYLLFSDQVGKYVEKCRGRLGVKWVRLLTDTPSGLLDILTGRLAIRDYLESLRGLWTEAVFSLTDPLPGLAGLILLPYLCYKRGF